MPRNRLSRVIKHHSPAGRRNHGRPLKRLLDMWNRNGSTSGPTPWQIYDDDNKYWHHPIKWVHVSDHCKRDLVPNQIRWLCNTLTL